MTKAPNVPVALQRQMVAVADTLLRAEHAWATDNAESLDSIMQGVDPSSLRMARDLLAQWAVLTEQLEVAA